MLRSHHQVLMLSFVTFRCIAGASLSLLLITYSTCPPISESPNPSTHTNALIHESSPYLLQHAHNPVDWRRGRTKRGKNTDCTPAKVLIEARPIRALLS